MRRSRIAATLFIVVAGVFASSHPCAAATGRAVSLKMLQNSLKAGDSRLAYSLCGITRLSGFIIDKDAKDIILIGRVDPELSPLYLDDFVVALRAAKLVYGRRERRTIYYAPPGCSIDPNPQVIKQLRQIRGRTGDASGADEWKAVGAKPQNVRVMGVPFDSRFAKVMVEADYYMKRLVNGSVDLGIEGFESLMGMRYALADAELRNDTPNADSGMAMNRFWFCPGECSYSEDNGTITLRECRVKLLTEEEFVAASGKTTGTGRSSDLAQRFADAFTSKYREIAAQKPIYTELESLFRLAALARLMEDRKVAAASGASLDYLVTRHKIGVVPVARKLPGLTRVQELSHRTDTDEGYQIQTLTLLSCGGVSMDVRPKRIVAPRRTASSAATKGRAALRSAALAGRKSKSALFWDFPMAE